MTKHAIDIVSDGTIQGTILSLSDTGDKLTNVKRMSIAMDAETGVVEAVCDVFVPTVRAKNIEALFVPECRECALAFDEEEYKALLRAVVAAKKYHASPDDENARHDLGQALDAWNAGGAPCTR